MVPLKILYLAQVPWRWIKQRPHFTAEFLAAAGHQVDYCFFGPLGKSKFYRHRSGNLHILERRVLPLALTVPWIEACNRRWIRHWFAGSRYDVIVLTEPRQWWFLPEHLRRESRILYDCMDAQPLFQPPHRQDRVRRQEATLCAAAAHIVVSSRHLRATLAHDYPGCAARLTVIKNAAAADFLSTPPRPVALPKPNVLYLGTIDHWLDWPLLIRYARNHPELTVVLVGPVGARPPAGLPANIRLTGAVPHDRVRDYLNAAEVLLLPFQVTGLIRGVDPVKLYEYLAVGKPIVAAWWEELADFPAVDRLRFYRDEAEFSTAVAAARHLTISGPDPEFLAQNCWPVRLAPYRKLLYPLSETE